MKQNYSLGKLLLTAVLGILLSGSLSAQNVITITDNQSYIEDFEGNGFSLWTVDTTGGGNWAKITGTLSSVASFSYQNAGDEARLISPVFDMSNVTEVTLNFSYAMLGLYTQDVLEVAYRTSDTSAWQLFLFVDNVEVASTSSCARPISLSVGDITHTSAQLNWVPTGDETSWTIELNGQETVVSTQPYVMTGLTPQTEYTFRVRANCAADDQSEWSTAITFTTYCDVYVVTDQVPYLDDFESSSDFVCWHSEIVSGTDGWVVDPGYLITNNTAFFIWLGEEARLVSRPLDISSVTQPTLTFKRRQPQGASDVDELSVWYRSSSNDNWQLLEYFPLPTEGWETEIVNLPNPSQNYQIAFVGMGYNAEGIYVDDVEVGKRSVGIAENQIATAVVSPNPTTGKAMLETGILEGEASVYDMFGKFVTSARISEGRAEIDLTQCTRGVYAVRLNGANASTIIKLVKE